MGNFEKEVKVLDIKIEEMQKKLEEIGAVLKESGIQKIYVYDLPSIYARYYDCILQLRNCSKPYDLEVCKSKMKELFLELDNLITDQERNIIQKRTGFTDFQGILLLEDKNALENILTNSKLVEIVKKYGINPNKWVRLRQTNGRTTITIKHIMNKNLQQTQDRNIQPVLETEMEVPSIEIGNAILEQLGFSYRNYQEKRRITYRLGKTEIDLDHWPLIPPYMEIEAESSDEINGILQRLNIDGKEIVSCNTAQVYEKYGIDLYKYRTLRFEDKNEELEI